MLTRDLFAVANLLVYSVIRRNQPNKWIQLLLELTWRFGVVVTRRSRSTQLLYIEPG